MKTFRRPIRTALAVLAVAAVPVGAVGVPSFAGTAASGAAASEAAAGGCRVHRLPQPALPGDSVVTGGDPSGRYLIGARWTTPEEGTPLLWIDRRLRELRTPYERALIKDVNASGVLVGAGSRGAWRYQDGRFTTLASLRPGYVTDAVAINARGDILGISHDPATFEAHVLVWPAGQPDRPRELTPPPGASSDHLYAVDIDDDGTVVGGSYSPMTVGYIWPRGGAARVLHGPADEPHVYTWKIRGGWIAGGLIGADGEIPAAWRSRGRAANVLGVVGRARAVNRHGDLAVSGAELPAAIAHHGGRIVPLPGVDGPDRGAVVTLSDSGVAAGWLIDGPRARPVLWLGC
ncbi:hypothetical protein [Kribbella sp. NPDC050470]|uniref:hypothetical protein n=1 Tax=unclassified Kribbella TaxID=2644121 RepID=UPI0037AB7C2E